MEISFQNEDRAIQTCEEIMSENQKLADACEVLSSCLNQISANWESNGADKQSYVTELEKQINNIDYLTSSIKDVANTLRNYAQNAKAAAQQTMN